VLNDFKSGDPQPQFTMDGLVDLIMKAPPEVVTELHRVATEISGVQLPLTPPNHHNVAAQSFPQQTSYPLTPTMQDQVNFPPQPPEQGPPECSDTNTLEGILQGLASGGEVPEGFDLILAELAGEAPKSPTPESEPAVETPKISPIEPPPTPEGMEIVSNLEEINVDELLAALAAADSDPNLVQDVLGGVIMSTQDGDDDNRLEALSALLGSDVGEGTDCDMTEEALEKIINDCGIDLSTANVGDLTNAQLTSIDEAISQHNEEAAIDIPPDALEGMSMEEINQLLGALNNAEELAPTTSTTPTPSQDPSAHYTPENVAAILKAIFEGITSPIPLPTKRQLPPPPPRPVFQCSVDILRSPTSSEAKRLVPLKPPPYMTMPTKTTTSIGAVQLPIPLPPKRKTGEEEKKIKAMGFPPLMAGIKRKAE
jgi:ribosomal protein L12E/L44/L45/RPP1/RPP2